MGFSSRFRTAKLLPFVAGSALAVCPVASHAQSVFSAWDQSDGNWTDASRWSTPEFPNNGNGGFDYNASIYGGTVTLDDFITIDSLEIGGGELVVDPPFELFLQDLDLVGGSISGSGTINPDNLNLLNSATLSGVTVDLQGGSELFVGNINNTVTLNNGATINNSTTLTPQRVSGGGDPLTIADYQMFIDGGTGTNRFVNEFSGIFIKPVGDANLDIGVRFDNDGRVEVEQGRLGLFLGGVSGGDFDVDTDGTLLLRGTHQLQNAFVSGDGTIQVLRGTTSLDQFTNYFVGTTQIQAGTLEVDSSSVQRDTEILQLFDGAEVVETSTSSNPQTFSVNETLEIQTGGGDVATLRGLNLELGSSFGPQSSVDFLSGQLVLDEGTTITHRGTFNLELANPGIQDFDITPIIGGATGVNTFVNDFSGVVLKSAGSGSLRFGVVFDNNGRVEVEQGTLILAVGGVSEGDFVIDTDGTLQLRGTHQLQSAFVSGDGTVQIRQGTTSLDGFTNFFVGRTQIQTGTLQVDSSSVQRDTDILQLFDGAAFVETSAGSDPRTFSVNQTLVIDTSSSDVATLLGLNLELGNSFGSQSSVDYFSGQVVLDEDTTITHLGTLNLELANPNVQSSDITLFTAGPTGVNTFVNNFSGVIQKLDDNGEVNFDVAFNNEGRVEVERGELRLNRGGVSDGDFDIDQLGEIIFAGGHDLSGAFITGDGDVTFEAGPAPAALLGPNATATSPANVIGEFTQYNIGGRTTLHSGTLTINTDFAESESLLLSSGLLNGTGTITVDFLTGEGDVQVDSVQIVVQNFYSVTGGSIITSGGADLAVQGNFEVDEESSFKALFDNTPGAVANRFAAQGAGDISGLLEIELADDFSAEVGDVFELFSAQQGITGGFRNVALGESITEGDFTFTLIDPDAVVVAGLLDNASVINSVYEFNGLPTRLALQVDAVPEPGTIGFLGAAAMLLLARRRRGPAGGTDKRS